MTARRFARVPFDARLIDSFLRGCSLESCELLTGGACNSNYRIRVSGEDFVVRYYNRGSPEHDRRVLNLVWAVAPAPNILDAGDAWAVMSYLPGLPLSKAPDAAADAGRTLAAIGKITFERSGWIEDDRQVRPFEFGGLLGFIYLSLEKPEVQRRLGAEMLRGIERLIKEEKARISEIEQEACLVHGDYNPGNILVRDHRVTGVVDWEFAHSGSPYADIGNLLRHLGQASEEVVAAGLREGGTVLPPDWRRRAALVDLTSHLEFLTSTMPESFKRRCVARIATLLG